MKKLVLGLLLGAFAVAATVGATHYLGDRSVAAAMPDGN